MSTVTNSPVRARDVMTAEVITVGVDLTLRELVDRLEASEISGAPVVDDGGRVVGVVTLADVAGRATGGAGVSLDRAHPEFFVRGWEEKYSFEELRSLRIVDGDLTVGDVMPRQLYTVEDDAPLDEIAAVMLQAHIHRVLVTRAGELAGIVSSLDLLRSVFGRGRT